MNDCILTINGGSSSIKFALYDMTGSPRQLLSGEIESIGSGNTRLNTNDPDTKKKTGIDVNVTDYNDAINFLIEWIGKQEAVTAIKAIGHRIVHGMQHTKPEPVTEALLLELRNICAYDPEHLPGEIKLIEAFKNRYPALMQIACFDTSFHTSMPQVAKWLSIPRRYYAMGIQRYGFHGLSYSYLLQELERIAGNKTAKSRLIIAHLGNGASVAAIHNGLCVDTSMGFTPTSGITMSTRTGDLDPGVSWYLMKHEKMDPATFSHLVNHESGLLGISETSSDMRELIKLEVNDTRAGEAIALFCYQTKKCIGSFAAVLGGIDTLIFSGGIGENTPEVREQICNDLGFLGIELDTNRNDINDSVISRENARVTVRVMKTNEELQIAKLVWDVLNNITTT